MCAFREYILTDDSGVATYINAQHENPRNDSNGAQKFQTRTKNDILADAADVMSQMASVVESGTTNL